MHIIFKEIYSESCPVLPEPLKRRHHVTGPEVQSHAQNWLRSSATLLPRNTSFGASESSRSLSWLLVEKPVFWCLHSTPSAPDCWKHPNMARVQAPCGTVVRYQVPGSISSRHVGHLEAFAYATGTQVLLWISSLGAQCMTAAQQYERVNRQEDTCVAGLAKNLPGLRYRPRSKEKERRRFPPPTK